MPETSLLIGKTGQHMSLLIKEMKWPAVKSLSKYGFSLEGGMQVSVSCDAKSESSPSIRSRE